jgi:anti-repressor protein
LGISEEKGKQMENKFKVFSNEHFGDVRIKAINGEPWFVAADVCKALKISNSRDALGRLDDDEKGVVSTDTLGGKQEMSIVNETGLYSLVLGSRKPEAKEFKRWITHEVIPMIRETGGYIESGREEDFINMYFPTFSDDTKLAMVLDLHSQNEKLKDDIVRQKPLVEFANHVSDTEKLVSVGEFAKMINCDGIPIGRNKLYDWLRENKYVRENREPYQQYVDAGLLKLRETVKSNMYGSEIYPQTFITGKGQLYFTKKLKAAFVV